MMAVSTRAICGLSGRVLGVPVAATPDHGRHDLNAGLHRRKTARRFDLDRIGSTQFGAAAYAVLAGGDSESSLTDAEILYFYATPWSEGTIDSRNQLLQDLCPLTVAVTRKVRRCRLRQPALRGDRDRYVGPRVTWSATGRSITAAGMFTPVRCRKPSFAQQRSSIPTPSASDTHNPTASPGTQVSCPLDGDEERGITDPTSVRLARWRLQPVGSRFRVIREPGVGVYFRQVPAPSIQCSPTST